MLHPGGSNWGEVYASWNEIIGFKQTYKQQQQQKHKNMLQPGGSNWGEVYECIMKLNETNKIRLWKGEWRDDDDDDDDDNDDDDEEDDDDEPGGAM